MSQGKTIFIWVVIAVGAVLVLLGWGAWEGLLRTQVFTGEVVPGETASENLPGTCRCFCFGPAADPERAALGYTVALDSAPRSQTSEITPQTKDYPELTKADCSAKRKQEACQGYRIELDGSSELVEGVYDGCGLLQQE